MDMSGPRNKRSAQSDLIEIYDLDSPSNKKSRRSEEHEEQATTSGTPVLRRSKRLTRTTEEIEDIMGKGPSVPSAFPTPPSSAKRGRKKKNVVIHIKDNDKDKVKGGKVDSKTKLSSAPQPPRINPLVNRRQVPPTLLNLPCLVHKKLFSYLDVTTLENLSKTCSFFDLSINGTFLSSIGVPFDANFIKELKETTVYEKKPLLKLVSTKSKESFNKVFKEDNAEMGLNNMMFEGINLNRIISEGNQVCTDYILFSQLSMLNLDMLREVDLVPQHLTSFVRDFQLNNTRTDTSIIDMSILRQLAMCNAARHVTRLNIVLDVSCLEEFEGAITQFPQLYEFGIGILARRGESKHIFLTQYLGRLENFLSKITAPVLNLNILSEAKRLIPKVLINKHIERLKITGPCTFNIYPVMENLKEIDLTFDKAVNNNNDDCCTYFKSKIDDRKIHRQGLCVLNLAAAFQNCPKLEKFMGIDLTSTFSQEKDKKKKRKQEKEKDKPQELTFSRWSLRVKKLLYEVYTKEGGTMEMKKWSKSRWVSKKPVIPAHVGVQRVANAHLALLAHFPF